jgi:hypothetical protein
VLTSTDAAPAVEAPPPRATGGHRRATSFHGIAGDDVRFGAATWFHDVLVRFGYDLPEHEHPWDGEWIDDAFEAAAKDLRSTGSKLLMALEGLDGLVVDGDRAETAPLAVDAVVAYLERLLRGVAVAVPCCFGQEGRVLAPARHGGLEAMADAVAAIDRDVAAALRPPRALSEVLALGFATHSPELYLVLDAAGPRPALPRAAARFRDASAATTATAVPAIDRALAAACPWLDRLVVVLQSVVAARAEDGDDLLARWAQPDWSVVRRTTPALAPRLPALV